MRSGAHLHLVTGKGGTGRTTIALALGLALAARGLRVLLVELGADGGLGRMAGVPLDAPHPLAPGCSLASLAPEPALERFLDTYLPSRRLAAVAKGSPVLRALFRAAPGTVEVAQLDALVRATARFDRVIVDGEASGQTLALLETPDVFGGLGAHGVVGERLEELARAIRSGAWSALVTTLARPFVLAETRTLADGLAVRGLAARFVVTGPEPAGVSAASARAAHAALLGSVAEEDLAFLLARAEEEDATLASLPGAIDARGPRPSQPASLAALGARIAAAVEA
jgi:hypothetical protein